MANTVVGIFENTADSQTAVQQLLNNGFTNDNVDISSGNADNVSNTDYRYAPEHESGISRFFKNLFGDDDAEAEKYSRVAYRNNSIVTVHANSSDEAKQASEILDNYGALNVDAKATEYGYYSDADNTDNTTDNINANRSIPIIEENIEVGKKTVQTGGVRLKSRIVETPVEKDLRLNQEYVRVERNAVDREATSADFDAFKEGEIEVKEHGEIPVVSKKARVVEEVSLGKDVQERNETIKDSVRKTQVDVEDLKSTKPDVSKN